MRLWTSLGFQKSKLLARLDAFRDHRRPEHKLAQVMPERNAAKRLKGKVQMDDAYLGGERSGPPGRGASIDVMSSSCNKPIFTYPRRASTIIADFGA